MLKKCSGLYVHSGGDLLVEIYVFALFMRFNQLLNDISNGHHHQLSSAEVTWQRPTINKVRFIIFDKNVSRDFKNCTAFKNLNLKEANITKLVIVQKSTFKKIKI